jgi:hypothetical protein
MYNITLPFFEKCFQKTVLSVVYVSIRETAGWDVTKIWFGHPEGRKSSPVMMKTFAYYFTDYLFYVLAREGGGKFNFCASVTIACAPPD